MSTAGQSFLSPLTATSTSDLCSKMTVEAVFETSNSVDGATIANSQHLNKHFDVSPSSPMNDNACWTFHSPPSTTSLVSPSLTSNLTAVEFSANEMSSAFASTTPTSKCNHHGGEGELDAYHDVAYLHHSPTFSESHDSFLSQSSDNANDCPDANDDTENNSNDQCLPSLCNAALASSDISADHLLEFVMRLTDTPPDRHHHHRANNYHHTGSSKDHNNNNHSQFDSHRPRCMTEDAYQLRRASAPILSSSTATALLDDLSSFAATVHRNPQFEHSLFSHSTTATSETHDITPRTTTHLYSSSSSSSSTNTLCNAFPSSTLDAATCRSTLSLISNNGSLTTAASTPSGTPTWSQDLTPSTTTVTSGTSPILLQQQSASQDSLLLGHRLLCSPLSDNSDTPTGSIEELLSDDDQVDCLSASQRSSTYFHSNFLRLIDDPLVNDHGINFPLLRPINKSSGDATAASGLSSTCINRPGVISAANESLAAAFQSSPQCKTSTSTTGLRHMNSGTTTTSTTTNAFIQSAAAAGGGSGEEDDAYGRQGGGNGSSNGYGGYNDGNWNDDIHRHNQRRHNNNANNNGVSIAKGLTDFYSLAYASKRWQNLNVVLPLYIPHGVVAVIRSTGENTYLFPDQYPASQLLFSGSGKICDMWATYLRLRVAVIHKCPEFLVPRVAQVFNHVLANLPKFSEPIHLRCAGVVKHTIQLRSSGGLTYRYDTIGQISNSADQEKMRVLFDGLQKVMSEVNHYLAREVEDVFKSLQGRGCDLMDDSDVRGQSQSSSGNNPRCGLEFRFSPCKELKIAIREGTVCDCAGVDSVIAGGGASSMSSWAQQFIVENLIVGELRLERDKTSETQLDPFFLPHAEIKTRMISKDLDGNPARICFVEPSVYPDYYRPRADYAIGLTPLQAAEQLVGATHAPLAKLLPNGMNSLTSQPAGAPLHIPGVSGLPHIYNNTAVGGSSSSVPVTPFVERNAMTGSSLGRQLFNQTVSNYSSSPSPSDPSSWSAGFPGAAEHRQDPFAYTRQQQQLGWTAPSVTSRGMESNRETPVTGDAASALKGLAVLQKMLSNLNLSNQTPETENATDGLEQSPVDLISASPSSGKAVAQQHLGAVLGQAAAAAMALGRHHETITKTPEAAALLSQLQSALQKIPSYVAGGTTPTATNHPQNVSPTDAPSSSPLFASPKPDESLRQQQQAHHPHLPFPCIVSTSASANRQHLFEIESLEEMGESNRSTIIDSDGTTPHIIDEHDLSLFRGSKSVGATPVNYSSTTSAGGGALGASPTTTISCTSFVRGGVNSESNVQSKDISASPTPCTTVEGAIKNGLNSTGESSVLSSTEDVEKRRTFGNSREDF